MSKLIAVVGETATGKSSLALELAERFNGEIINADSWLVYRGMDIGTAKPRPEERRRVPHHLIDIVGPDEDFTAADYKKLAEWAIEEVAGREKLPILVGGTGLYIDSVLFDYSFLPPGAKDEREHWNALSIPQLITEIEHRGLNLTGVDKRNKRRLIRLLETGGQTPSKSSKIRPNTLVIGLKVPRSKLRENIEKRVEVMFKRGLKHEVEELAKRYDWDNEAMKGIGYRELKPYFEGKQSNAETKRKIIKNTLNLAKRQRTWFKRNRTIKWVQSRAEAIKLVKEFIEER